MDGYNTNGHSVYDIKYHIKWVTKYKYHVLKGEVASSVRELISFLPKLSSYVNTLSIPGSIFIYKHILPQCSGTNQVINCEQID